MQIFFVIVREFCRNSADFKEEFESWLELCHFGSSIVSSNAFLLCEMIVCQRWPALNLWILAQGLALDAATVAVGHDGRVSEVLAGSAAGSSVERFDIEPVSDSSVK